MNKKFEIVLVQDGRFWHPIFNWMVRTNHFIFMFLMLGYTVPHTPRRGGGGILEGALLWGVGGQRPQEKTHQCIRKRGIWCVKSMLWEYYLYTAIATIFYFSNCYYLISATPCKLALQRKNRFPGKKMSFFTNFFCSRDNSQGTKRMELLKPKIGP